MEMISRDQIALEVMKCLLNKESSMYGESLAKRSYEIAEAMLVERNKQIAKSVPVGQFGKQFIADPVPTVQKE